MAAINVNNKNTWMAWAMTESKILDIKRSRTAYSKKVQGKVKSIYVVSHLADRCQGGLLELEGCYSRATRTSAATRVL